MPRLSCGLPAPRRRHDRNGDHRLGAHPV